jgi:hypothetical protein
MIDEQQDTDTNRNDYGTFKRTRILHRIDKTFNDSVLFLTWLVRTSQNTKITDIHLKRSMRMTSARHQYLSYIHLVFYEMMMTLGG